MGVEIFFLSPALVCCCCFFFVCCFASVRTHLLLPFLRLLLRFASPARVCYCLNSFASNQARAGGEFFFQNSHLFYFLHSSSPSSPPQKKLQFDFALAEGAPPVGMTTGATIHTSGGLMLRLTKREHGGKGGGGGGAETPVSAEAAVVV